MDSLHHNHSLHARESSAAAAGPEEGPYAQLPTALPWLCSVFWSEWSITTALPNLSQITVTQPAVHSRAAAVEDQRISSMILLCLFEPAVLCIKLLFE